MPPTIKCFDYPMKLRQIKCQRILTSTQVADEESMGFEIFVSKIPSDADEDELIPFFEKVGPLHTFRLMMEMDQCSNRGHAYVTYIHEKDARDAVSLLNGRPLRKGHHLSVTRSFNNCRIFIGGIPVNKTKDEVWHEMQKQGVPNIVDVIMYRSYSNRNLNRGFVFVEFPTHKFAAKMRLKLRGLKLWNYKVIVDWSVPQPVVSEEEMCKVKIVYLKNLEVTESKEDLKVVIEKYVDPVDVEKVYKFKDYAFVHLRTRELALQLVELLKVHYEGTFVEIMLAKPRNQYTKPGYRKLRMMKNNPYLPMAYTQCSNTDSPNRVNSPQFNSNYFQTSSKQDLMENWIHSLPMSTICCPPSNKSFDVNHWNENEHIINEDRKKSAFDCNFPIFHHISNGMGCIQSYHGTQSLETLNKTMENLKICCPRDHMWKIQDVLEEDQYEKWNFW